MQTRQLGLTGLEIAPIILGTNVFGWTADGPTSHDIIDRALDRGFNCLDTADVYSAWAPNNSGGESEEVIGDWIEKTGRRDEIVLMTKVGMLDGRKGLSEENIKAALEDSLRRLKTDYVDVYFAHADDSETPLTETMEAFGKLKQQGKIRHVGASNYSATRLEEAASVAQGNGMANYEVLQPEYNLVSRGYEDALRDSAIGHGMAVTPYFSLASGFLTGKYRSKADIAGTDREAMLGTYFEGRGPDNLEALIEVAERRGCEPAQVALAWLINRDGVTAPIASARNAAQLETVLSAADLDLDDEEMEKLTAAGT